MFPVLRAEWVKSLARSKRWTEEVMLLKEEMRRVLAFLEWRANWWLSRPAKRSAEPSLQEGIQAYANRQAVMFQTMRTSFLDRWSGLEKDSVLPISGVVQEDGMVDQDEVDMEDDDVEDDT